MQLIRCGGWIRRIRFPSFSDAASYKLPRVTADLVGVVPRPRRNILPNRIYLVSQQGNKQHPVYLDDQDRAFATKLLRICSLRYGVKVLAFGYGVYEGRWLLRPSNRRGLSCLMRDMQSTYSRYLNEKYEHRPCCAQRRMNGEDPCHSGTDKIRNSSNWTARFKATEIDPAHFADALEYIRSLKPPRPGGRFAASSNRWIRLAIAEALHRSRPLRRTLARGQGALPYGGGATDVRAP